MYKAILIVVMFIGLTACATNNYVGQPADHYQRLSCTLKESKCGINYGDEGYISYSVEEIAPNTYTVKGYVDLNMDVVGGMHPKLSFYVIFMDEDVIQYERKVRTGSRKATFEFEIETKKAIQKSTITKMTFHTWS